MNSNAKKPKRSPEEITACQIITSLSFTCMAPDELTNESPRQQGSSKMVYNIDSITTMITV